VKIVFDPAKSERNARERNLPFERGEDFDWESALYREDVRKLYGEPRFIAIGYLEDRLHVVCFSPTTDGVRVISFRKANDREVRRYEAQTAEQ
jgi:uncharacterized protein